jgi:hypothetical protein
MARDGIHGVDHGVVHAAAVLRMRMADHHRSRGGSGLFEVRFELTGRRCDHHHCVVIGVVIRGSGEGTLPPARGLCKVKTRNRALNLCGG